MARVAFDLTVAAYDRGGSGVVARELFNALRAEASHVLEGVTCPGTRPVEGRRGLRDRAHTLLRDLWWFPHGVATAAARRDAEILHVPMLAGPRATMPVVITIHDLAIQRYPEAFRGWYRRYVSRTLPRALDESAAIITVSEFSKTEIVEAGADPARVHVVHNGLRRGFAPASPADVTRVRRHYGLPERFVLTVGALEPRKNHALLARAVAAASASVRTSIPLVHAGPSGWITSAEESGLRSIGYVPDGDLPALYSAARMLAYPSLFEGFGLPVLEAMACGTPVITTDGSSLHEVAGDAALLVDATSIDAVADAIARLWCDDALHADLRTAGHDRAPAFTWERAATLTSTVYDTVLRT